MVQHIFFTGDTIEYRCFYQGLFRTKTNKTYRHIGILHKETSENVSNVYVISQHRL